MSKRHPFWKVREAARARNNAPVKIVEGSMPPTVGGEGHYYVNKSGDRIFYPTSYMKAWGKPIYVASTICVAVGLEWCVEHAPEASAYFAAKILKGRDV